MENTFINDLTTLEYDKSMLEYFVKSKNTNKPTLSLLILNITLQISKLSNMHNIIKILKNDLEFIDSVEQDNTTKRFLTHIINAMGCLIDDSIYDFTKESLQKNTKDIKYTNFLEFEGHLIEAIKLLLKNSLIKEQEDSCIKSLLVIILSTFITNYGIVMHDYIDFEILYKNINFDNLTTVFRSDSILKMITYFTNNDSLETKIREYKSTIKSVSQLLPYFRSIVEPYVNAINTQLFENTHYYKNVLACHNVKEIEKCLLFMESLCDSNNQSCRKDLNCYECISPELKNKIYEANKEIQHTILNGYYSHEHTIINSAINGSILCQIICKSEILIGDDFLFQPDKMTESFSEFKITANIDVIESIIENLVTYILPLVMDTKGNSAILTKPQVEPAIRNYFGFTLPSMPSLPKLGSIYYGALDFFNTKPLPKILYTLYLDWGINQYLIKYPIDSSLKGSEGNENTGRKLKKARSKYYSEKLDTLSLFFELKYKNYSISYLMANGNLNISSVDTATKFLDFKEFVYGQLYYNLYSNSIKQLSFSCISQLPLKATVNNIDKNLHDIALKTETIEINYLDVIYLFNKYAFNNYHFHLYRNEFFVNVLYKCKEFSMVHILPLESYVRTFKNLKEVETISHGFAHQSQNVVDVITPSFIKYTIGKGFAYASRALGKVVKKSIGINRDIIKSVDIETTYDAISTTISSENYIKYTNYQKEYKRQGNHNIYIIPNDIDPGRTLQEKDIIEQINNIHKYKNSFITLVCDKSSIASGSATLDNHAMIFARDKIIGSYDNTIQTIKDQYLYTTDLYKKIYEKKQTMIEIEKQQNQKILTIMGGRKEIRSKKKKRVKGKLSKRRQHSKMNK